MHFRRHCNVLGLLVLLGLAPTTALIHGSPQVQEQLPRGALYLASRGTPQGILRVDPDSGSSSLLKPMDFSSFFAASFDFDFRSDRLVVWGEYPLDPGLDRLHIAWSELLAKARRVPVEPCEAGQQACAVRVRRSDSHACGRREVAC